jgi:cysteine dioxygenase
MATLQQFLEGLNEYECRVPLAELEALLCDLEVTAEELASCVLYDEANYKRNLLSEGDAYQALVLCWLPGQLSPIHDHTGSSCGVRVISGICTEIMYQRNADGTLSATEPIDYPAPGVRGAQDSDIHIVGNFGTEGLVTLHVYSPPLRLMNTYAPSGEVIGAISVPAAAAT